MRDVQTSIQPDQVTTIVVTIPARVAGDLLILIHNEALGRSLTIPSGWTQIGDSLGANNITHWLARIASGDSGDDTTLTISGGARQSVICYSISGWQGTIADAVAFGFVDGLDPPLVTPAWGSAENLWLTGLATRRCDWVLAAPANYGDQVDVQTNPTSTSLGTVGQSSAHRILEAASENPAAWSVTSGSVDGPHGWTLAVRPAA